MLDNHIKIFDLQKDENKSEDDFKKDWYKLFIHFPIKDSYFEYY